MFTFVLVQHSFMDLSKSHFGKILIFRSENFALDVEDSQLPLTIYLAIFFFSFFFGGCPISLNPQSTTGAAQLLLAAAVVGQPKTQSAQAQVTCRRMSWPRGFWERRRRKLPCVSLSLQVWEAAALLCDFEN